MNDTGNMPETTEGGMYGIAGRRDLELVQALNQAKAMVDRESHSADAWDELADELDNALGHVTETTTDISYVKEDTGDRIERPHGVEHDLLERVRASLIALFDRPELPQIEDALDAVRDFNRAVA